jgi:predicted enzyme related to lactoylglutathione lyase
MGREMKLVVYPTKDMTAAKGFYQQLLGIDPYVDGSYYVGFRTETVEIGLAQGEATLAYWDTPHLEETIDTLVSAGGQVHKHPTEVGGGLRIAVVRDPSGNLVGLREAAA